MRTLDEVKFIMNAYDLAVENGTSDEDFTKRLNDLFLKGQISLKAYDMFEDMLELDPKPTEDTVDDEWDDNLFDNFKNVLNETVENAARTPVDRYANQILRENGYEEVTGGCSTTIGWKKNGIRVSLAQALRDLGYVRSPQSVQDVCKPALYRKVTPALRPQPIRTVNTGTCAGGTNRC